MERPFLDYQDFAICDGFTRTLWLFSSALAVLLILSALISTATKAQFEDKTIEAKELEAKIYVAAMNKGQQAHYLEYGDFVDSISKLKLSIKSETANYNYSVYKEKIAVFNYAISRQANLKSVVGGVFIVSNATETIICQAKVAGITRPAIPTNTKGVVACGANTTPITVRLERW